LKSVSAVNGYRNAIKALYVEKRLPRDACDKFDSFIKDYINGYKREVGKKKNQEKLKLQKEDHLLLSKDTAFLLKKLFILIGTLTP
jgi:hypothetical protein